MRLDLREDEGEWMGEAMSDERKMMTIREAALRLSQAVEHLAELDVNCTQSEDLRAWGAIHEASDAVEAALTADAGESDCPDCRAHGLEECQRRAYAEQASAARLREAESILSATAALAAGALMPLSLIHI